MANIPPELVQSYIHCSNLLFPESSGKLFIGIADNGNHFLEHGIKEGTNWCSTRRSPSKKGSFRVSLTGQTSYTCLPLKSGDTNTLAGLLPPFSLSEVEYGTGIR